MKKLFILVPAFKCSSYLPELYNSVTSQSEESWRLHIAVDDCPSSYIAACEIAEEDSRVSCSLTPTRLYALGNIVKTIDAEISPSEEWIVGIIDGDDKLINNETFSLILDAYKEGAQLAWTKYTWDDNSTNCISNHLPPTANPYHYPWVSSHFRTFGNWIYNKINRKNFKDSNSSFFKRAYDQALMLPMLYYCNRHALKTTFVSEYCYRYNHENTSTPPEEHTHGSYEGQLAQFIRKRGYIE